MTVNETALATAAQPQAQDVMSVIARAASDPTVDVAKMEALLNMQERLMRMRAEQDFNAALVDLQAKVPRVTKHGQIMNNKGTVQSTFARYEDIDTAIRPLMRQYGFAVSFDNPKTQGGLMEFTAELRHRAGHNKDYHLSLPVDTSGAKNGTQGAGSTFSYAKRYLICDILNIITEGEDNDGNGSDPVISDNQLKDLEILIRDARANVQRILTFAGVEKLEDIPASKYGAIVKGLQGRTK